MKLFSVDKLRNAMLLTQSGRLTDATAAIQRMLGGLNEADLPTESKNSDPLAFHHAPTIDGAVHTGDPVDRSNESQSDKGQRTKGEKGDTQRFLAKTFSNQAGSRPYKVFVPNGYHGQPVPLIVMLHGCTQSPDDFAAGTRMNLAAEVDTCIVAYPGQISAANRQKCWNWFNANDQRRDGSEPSLIAGITQEIMHDYAIDPTRVYVAGLSAGGAAASVMGSTYPDLYAAVGVHSGLACGAARDMPSAFAAMQRGGEGQPRTGKQRPIPTIVFHGERDTTVNTRNGDAVVAQAVQGASLQTQVESGQVSGGHAYTRTLHSDARGRVLVEKWSVHGAGHAWFGGSSAGSYTDPRGPDATKEMLRFFLEHSL